MDYKDASARLADYHRQIGDLRKKMQAVRASAAPEEVRDYEFATTKGTVRLSALFGSKDDLFVIHNMGTSCSACTMWADGFNGVYHHLRDRAAFVVSSPDPPAVQQSFAAGRGWRFPIVSHQGTSFAADMGYRSEKGGWIPGVSAFHRDGGRILRVSDSHFDDGDDFCSVWHMFDLLPGGWKGWRPKIAYE